MYPVETVLSKDDILPSEIAETVAATVSRAHRELEGDILAFLPGQADIVRCAELLGNSLGATHVCELYGNLPPQQQYEAISPSAPGERKVVLATPIAETSLTIEGIRIVVDCGYYRKLVFDSTNDLSHLETVRISMDMARQRAGRAGRVAAGTCFRLWTHATQQRMDEQRQPEIVDADLVPMVLDVAAFGETDVESLPWLTPPPKCNVARAGNELRALHAISAEGQITPLGRKMAAMPCHPRISRMILQARNAQEKSLACDIAAILEEKDVMAQESNACSDLLLRVSALQDARRRNALGRWKRVGNIAEEYDRMVGIRPSNTYVAREDIGALVAAAYPERIAKAQDHNGNYRMANGGEVVLDAADPLTSFSWLAIATLHAGNGGRGRAFLAAPVSSQSLEDYATWWDNITWIAHQGGVIAQKEMRIGTLVVRTKPLDNVPKEQLKGIICEAAKKEGKSMLSWTDKTAALQERVALVAQWHPELGLPDLSADAVLKQPERWLPFYLEKDGRVITTISEMRKIDMESVLWNMLSYEQQQKVSRMAPTYIMVPSGSKIQLRYRKGSEVPVLSVRLQECFGLTATPRVNDGKVPVLMELLSPGFKPVQLTADLQSFWQDTYFEVRKELRRRYPKHYWPDNPLEAVAQRGVKRKR
jgi:ATP-dependent helicase HrpB